MMKIKLVNLINVVFASPADKVDNNKGRCMTKILNDIV